MAQVFSKARDVRAEVMKSNSESGLAERPYGLQSVCVPGERAKWVSAFFFVGSMRV